MSGAKGHKKKPHKEGLERLFQPRVTGTHTAGHRDPRDGTAVDGRSPLRSSPISPKMQEGSMSSSPAFCGCVWPGQYGLPESNAVFCSSWEYKFCLS